MKLLQIAAGDLKRVAKDRTALVWMLLMPLVMAYVFGSAFGHGGQQSTWIPVINLDQHELSAMFIDQLREDGYDIDIKGPEAQRELKSKWPYGIVIPPNFSDSILQGKSIQLPLVKGNAAPNKFVEVQSRLIQAIVRFTRGLAIVDISHRPWNDETRQALKSALARPQLLTVNRRGYHTLRPLPTGFNQSLPGMLVMFMMQMVLIYGGTSLVRDRLGGFMRRLFAAPVNQVEIYSGKIVSRMLLACAQALVLLACGAAVFRMPMGDHPFFLVPVILCLGAFAGSLSILGGIICQTEKQVILVAIFGAMLLSALGGCWWPIEIVPDTFKTIASFTPSYWAMHGLQSVLYFGKTYEVLQLDCPILLGFALLCGLAAVAAARFTGKRGVAVST